MAVVHRLRSQGAKQLADGIEVAGHGAELVKLGQMEELEAAEGGDLITQLYATEKELEGKAEQVIGGQMMKGGFKHALGGAIKMQIANFLEHM